ncbi:bacteriohemerythrin [mine drainage metagenome]|uniref:Bacteriohemerythrin n=1 Tax=mine drainage metagenome TaxID=410659 RepID=A0A1J5S9H1_9ZZZZ
MSFFSWNDKFSMGVEVIDHDHRILVDLIDQLHEAFVNGNLDETVTPVLDTLVDYTRFHFAREEELMAKAGYPALTQHQEVHRTLRRQVEEIQERVQGGTKMGNELLAFLQDWLYFHILEQDRAYSPYMAALFPAGQDHSGR